MKDQAPQPAATLHILLALADTPRHGYGIMQEILEQTDGAYKLGPATLYDTLQRMLDQGWVAETKGPANEDSRRRYYKLQPNGTAVLRSEIARLERVVRQGKTRLAERGAS
jgi:DNA-binding PadR family transcriptional regulator